MTGPPATGFCARCGAALTPGSGFCGSCGAPIGVTASAPALPPLAPAIAPQLHGAPHTKLSHTQVIVIAAAAVVVLAVVITLIAVKSFSGAQSCGFYCGPKTGPRLADPMSFTNTKWKFTVDYSGSQLTINSPDPTADSLDFSAVTQGGSAVGEIKFTAMPATSTQQAIQDALASFPSSQYTDRQQVEAVPGAEVGLDLGDGTAYTASQVSTAGSSGNQVGIVILAATHHNVTIVATMWSVSNTSGDAPFYLATDNLFDQLITNLHFQGG